MTALTAQEEKTLEQKIRLMSNYDPDRQFIAACDLSEFIDKNSARMPENIQSRIVDSLLEQLKSEVIDVHGNAIKCLSKIISKLPIDQSKRISEIMVRNVANPSINPDIRDVYGTCVKTIINDVPVNFGEHIKDLLKLTVEAAEQAGRSKVSVKLEEQLIDIASSFMRKWPKVVSRVQLDRIKFAEYLFGNITHKDEAVLKKRSCVCLGALASSFNKNDFNQILFGEKGVISFLKENQATDRVAIEKRKFTLQALSGILKSHPAEVETAQVIGKFLRDEAVRLKKVGESGNSDKSDEMLECVILSLQYLLKGIKNSEVGVVIKDHERFTKSLIELVQYSPHSQIAYHTDIQDEDQDYIDDTAADQHSWRVRRASLYLIGTVSLACSPMASQFASHTEIYIPLTQKNQSVAEGAFGMIEELATSLNHSFDDKAAISLLQNVYKQLNQLFKHNLQSKIYNGATKLLSDVAKKLSKSIVREVSLFQRFIQLAIKNLQKTKSNEAKLYLLNFLQVLLIQKQIKNYQQILKDLIILSDNSFYKISVASFKAIYAILSSSSEVIVGNEEIFKNLVEKIHTKSKQTGLDQQIKHIVTACVAELLSKYFQKLQKTQFNELVNILLAKLTTQVEKRQILSAISKINRKVQCTSQLSGILNNIIKVTANTCLPVSDDSIKSKACEALDTCISILQNQLQPQLATLIVSKSKDIMSSGDFPSFLDKLAAIYPQSFYILIDLLLNMVNPPIVAINHICNSKPGRKQEIIQKILSQLKQQNLKIDIKLMAGLGYVANGKHLDNDSLQTELNIGVIGYNANAEFFEQFLAIIKDPKRSDSIRQQTSKSIGKIISRNPGKLLDLFINQLEQHHKFLLLVALREYIKDTSEISTPLLKLEERLFTYCQHQNESFLNLLSECIGRIVGLDMKESQSIFLPKSNIQSINVKFVFANSYRSFFRQKQILSSDLLPYIAFLVNLISEKNLQIKSAVLKSLNMVLFYNRQLLNNLAEKTFLDHLSDALAFDSKNIQEVQIGNLVERIDRGKPLRLDGFSLLEALIEKVLPMDNEQTQVTVLNMCTRTIDTDSSVEVQVRRAHLIFSLLLKYPALLHSHGSEIVAKLFTRLQTFKEKKNVEDQNLDKMLEAFLKIIWLAYSNRHESHHAHNMETVYMKLQGIPRFKLLLEKIQTQAE